MALLFNTFLKPFQLFTSRKNTAPTPLPNGPTALLVARLFERAKRRINTKYPSNHDVALLSQRRRYTPTSPVPAALSPLNLPSGFDVQQIPASEPPAERKPEGTGNDHGREKEHTFKEHTFPIRMLDGRVIKRIRRDETLPDGTLRKTFWVANEAGNREPFTLQNDPKLPLFGAELLSKLPANMLVVVCEGEKAAESITRRNIAAVGTMTGANGTPSLEALTALLSFPVVLWPDADDIGYGHMQRVGLRLRELGHERLKWLTWKHAPLHGDAADYTGPEEALAAMLANATPFDSRSRHSIAAETIPIPCGPVRLVPEPTTRGLAPRLGAETHLERLKRARGVQARLATLRSDLAAGKTLSLKQRIEARFLDEQVKAILGAPVPRLIKTDGAVSTVERTAESNDLAEEEGGTAKPKDLLKHAERTSKQGPELARVRSQLLSVLLGAAQLRAAKDEPEPE